MLSLTCQLIQQMLPGAQSGRNKGLSQKEMTNTLSKLKGILHKGSPVFATFS